MPSPTRYSKGPNLRPFEFYSFPFKAPIVERVAGIEPASSAWKAEVLPLNHTRVPLSQLPSAPLKDAPAKWWWEKDSNLRRHSRQIYSLIPLTAREPHQNFCAKTRQSFQIFLSPPSLQRCRLGIFQSLPEPPGGVTHRSARCSHYPHHIVVPPQGVEPWTFSLQVSCSTS